MTTNCFARFAFVILLGTSVTLSGCLGRSQPSRFYLLQSSLILEETVLNQEGIKIALGPVSLPQHLDRPQIVTRVGENEFKLDEFNQWAETLSDNITLLEGDARETLAECETGIDFLFLDGWKRYYLPMLEMLRARLAERAVVAADNIAFEEAQNFVERVRDPDSGFVSSTIGQMEVSLLVSP